MKENFQMLKNYHYKHLNILSSQIKIECIFIVCGVITSSRGNVGF
jgi:hypothetical protein